MAGSSENFRLEGGRFLSFSGTAEGTDFRLSDAAIGRRFSANLLPIRSENYGVMPGSSGSRSFFGLPPGEVLGLELGRGDRRCTHSGSPCTSNPDCTGQEELCVLSAELEWPAESRSQTYNLYRSSMVPGSTCWWSDLPTTSFIDFEGNPDSGSVFGYLVTGENIWGESILGSRSNGAIRPNDTPCP